MALKKGDFVEVEYTGKIQENNLVFDTTSEEVAKKEGFTNDGHRHFGPVVIVLGERHLLQGLDDALEGKELGSYTFKISPEKAFGKKSAELLKLVPAKAFKKENVQPYVGLEITMGSSHGVVRSVSGGRVMVDFNHPLSGKELVYDITVNKIVEDTKEKIVGLGKLLHMHIKDVTLEGTEASIVYEHALPGPISEHFEKEIERLVNVNIKPAKETKKDAKEEETGENEEPEKKEAKPDKPKKNKKETIE
jgi:FKBP-type peptidyl-prolyl cis-trans isomerase 2